MRGVQGSMVRDLGPGELEVLCIFSGGVLPLGL